MKKGAAARGLVLGWLATAGIAGGRQADPLARLDLDPPGWAGIRLGMSLVQIERRLGVTLPLSPGAGRPVCSRFSTGGDYEGYRLVLGFPAAKPGAKLESMWVQFGGGEARASSSDLAAALRRRVPGALYLADARQPEASEAADPRPTYALPGEPAAAVRFSPRDGALIALRSCLP
jgi:hypothetical protein